MPSTRPALRLMMFGRNTYYLLPPAPTWEKVTALRELLADYKTKGCRFAYTPPPLDRPAHAVHVEAHAPAGAVLVERRMLLPDEVELNLKRLAALVGVWNAADVQRA